MKGEKMDAKALYLISYGMYIICSKNGDKINGQTANSVVQVASEPPIHIGVHQQAESDP